VGSSSYQPFNVFQPAKGVFPPAARTQVQLPSGTDSYYLMTSQEKGPRDIPFWHENTCHPETVVTLEGSYDITLGSQRLHQKAGDVLVIPTGVKHGQVSTQEGYRNLQIENTHAGCHSVPKRVDAVI
jgi:hypothetical protein